MTRKHLCPGCHAALPDGSKRDKAKALAADIMEYVAQIDFNKYFDTQASRSGLGGRRNQEFVDFSASSVKATQVRGHVACTHNCKPFTSAVECRQPSLVSSSCASCRPNWQSSYGCFQQRTFKQPGTRQHRHRLSDTSLSHGSVASSMTGVACIETRAILFPYGWYTLDFRSCLICSNAAAGFRLMTQIDTHQDRLLTNCHV